jgi:hypothetical protein
MSDQFYSNSAHTVLNQVREGMDVLDVNGSRVGTIKYIQFGDENPNVPGAETIGAQEYHEDNDSFIEDIAEALGGDDDVPEPVRAQLLRYGYIQIDTGLLSGDCFAMPNQIINVGKDQVRLNVRSEELMRF